MPNKTKGNSSATPSYDSDAEPLCFSTGNVILLVEKLTANFTVSFNSCMEKIVDAIDKKFDLEVEYQSTEIFNLH